MSDPGAPLQSPVSEIFTDPTPFQETYDSEPLPDPRDDNDLFPYQLECDTRALAGALSSDVLGLSSHIPNENLNNSFDGDSPFADQQLQHPRVTFDLSPSISDIGLMDPTVVPYGPMDPLDPSMSSPQNQFLELALQRSMEVERHTLSPVTSLKRAYSAGDVQQVLNQHNAEQDAVSPSSLSHTTAKQVRVRGRFPKTRSMFDVKNIALIDYLPKWLKIDKTGECTLVQIDKSRVSTRLGVQWRDMRIVDPKLATSYPSAILVRDKAIVVNLEYIKAIITSSYILVHNLSSEGVLSVVSKEPYLPFVEELKRKLAAPSLETMLQPSGVADPYDSQGSPTVGEGNRPGGKAGMGKAPPTALMAQAGSTISLSQMVPAMSDIALPFELRCLEVCLEHISGYWVEKVNTLDSDTRHKLDVLTGKVNTEHLEAVRSSKGQLNRYITKVETIREVLEKLLDDDKDMLAMNLTAKEAMEREIQAQNRPSVPQLGATPPRLPLPHLTIPRRTRTHTHSSSSSSSASTSSTDSEEEEQIADVEMLLEAYFMQMDNTYNKLQALKEYIDDTEDLVNTELDYNLNQLIEVDLLLTAGTFAITLVSCMEGIFGMNLDLSSRRTTIHSNWLEATFVPCAAAVLVFVGFFLVCKFKQIIVSI